MNERSATTLIPETARGSEAAILNAALEAFGEKGFYGASMRDVARGAKTSLSNLYNYFPAKSDLLAALLRMANDELLNRIQEAVGAAGKRPADRMSAAVRAHVRFVVEHQVASLVALSEIRYLTGAVRKRVVAARDSTQGIYEELVAEGAAAGDFLTPYPDDAARNIVSMVSAISTWYRAGGRLNAEELGGQHARYALALLEAPLD
ncbi:TetR/AcrR family transcriptional regulator [Amycolatopsis sp. K13G38]|uniref:TetR/AcrR family transcriptional regulator n=1 Tax=Amycolatopsis acididurans TaxID=2724524 RepID=A0ABX1JG16_9PSEU|nr:TetR/AcrR family transcriptional regulator [Amycolatopsis acididurans]NKQ57695.1 TetR/AcrR family transcriptional regulator [Amycolatopsis acididurans]